MNVPLEHTIVHPTKSVRILKEVLDVYHQVSGIIYLNTYPYSFIRYVEELNPISTGLFHFVAALGSGGSTPSITFDPDILEH